MNITIQPGLLAGNLRIIPSKSQAHRLLISAAFADQPTTLICPETNRDIEATVDCLKELGAKIDRTADGYVVEPIREYPEKATLPCCESGSTLRFMLPIVGALGIDATFVMEGRLPQRPLSPLWEEMERMGCSLSRPTPDTVRCTGKLRPGAYSISGNVSSQYITGLLFAHRLIEGECTLEITGKLESAPYVEMTRRAIDLFAHGSPGGVRVEGDWSNAAFWLAATALGSHVEVLNLDPQSAQGDRAVANLLPRLDTPQTIDVSDIPDLVPILSVVAGAKRGAGFINAGRLRLKETDRLMTTANLINSIGGCARIEGDNLIVEPSVYSGGTVDAANDHRIAMAAAIAATVCTGPVTILGADAVNKSYPTFWQDYKSLGGKI